MTRQVQFWAPIVIGTCLGLGPVLAVRGTRRMRRMPDQAMKPSRAGGGVRGGIVSIVGGALLLLVGFLPEGGGVAVTGIGLILGGIALMSQGDK